jgi:phosphoribosylaminoimidazolecarboxamide formyltransferase/IMP cyclohydrolase
MDSNYVPATQETRQVYGVSLEQRRNDAKITPELFTNVVSQNKDLPLQALTDLLVATLAIKYTQSNSVCYALRGGVVGLGAGQQSRIHCTRLAGGKADAWWMRHHPSVLAFKFRKGIKRAERANAIDLYATGEVWEWDETEKERQDWAAMFEEVPARLSPADRKAWMAKLKDQGVALASDAFFPFADNVARAVRSGVKYIAAPGGSVMDGEVIKAADENGLFYAFQPLRLFHH